MAVVGCQNLNMLDFVMFIYNFFGRALEEAIPEMG